MGHKPHSQSFSRKDRFRGHGGYSTLGGFRVIEIRESDLWLYPTEMGRNEISLAGPVCVESGLRPFLNERLGTRAVDRKLVTLNLFGSRIKFKDGQEVWLRQGKDGQGNEVLVGKLQDRSKGHTEENAIFWRPHISLKKSRGLKFY